MTKTLTKTQERKLRAELRGLEERGRATLRGRFLPWGVPWCAGPGRSELCKFPDPCEGCMGRAFCADQAARLVPKVLQLRAALTPVPVTDTLF
jgi:hypothetical protein